MQLCDRRRALRPATAPEKKKCVAASSARQSEGKNGKEMRGETCTCTCPTAARQSLISHDRRGFVSERFGRGGDSGGGTMRLQKKIM